MKLRGRVVVYGAAVLQGFAFTLVPALATVFAREPYRIDAHAFGALFVPLTVGAIAAAACAPRLAGRFGMTRVLAIGVVANIIGLLALIASVTVRDGTAYGLLLVDTLALGVGFGLNFSAVNELAADLSRNQTLAVTSANVLTGLGTALTPLVLGALIARGAWFVWPALLAAALVVVFALAMGWSGPVKERGGAQRRRVPRALVLFGLAALLYAICEGAFSSWATTFAHVDRGFSLATGEAALAGFWLALTITRVIASLSTRLLPARLALVTFPIAIAIAFALLPAWPKGTLLVVGFILGGIACSIVFPYAMSLALQAMPQDEDRVAGVLVGALMTGEGFGTFAIGLIHGGGVGLSWVYYGCAIVALVLTIVAMLARSARVQQAYSDPA